MSTITRLQIFIIFFFDYVGIKIWHTNMAYIKCEIYCKEENIQELMKRINTIISLFITIH